MANIISDSPFPSTISSAAINDGDDDVSHISKERPGIQQKLSGNVLRRFRQRNEATRDRDVFRCLSSWESIYRPDGIRYEATTQFDSAITAQQCPDKTLTSLGQLCALQLNARTCLISLVCRKTEYILADVSSSTPLQPRLAGLPDRSTWIGTTSFDRNDGLSSRAVGEWQKARRPREVSVTPDDAPRATCTPHWYIIDDVRDEKHGIDQLALLRRGSWIRFYAAVPLRNGQGSVVGALTIFDDKPRAGLNDHELTLLEDLSDTIAEHLHATITRTQQQRSERLLRGLSAFNSGGRSMRDWWLAKDDIRVNNQGRNTQQGSATDRTDRVDRALGVEHKTFPADDSDVALNALKRASLHQATTSTDTEDNRDLEQPYTTPIVSPIHATYDRASNLLREAMGVDGVAFVSINASSVRTEQENHMQDELTGSESEMSEGSVEKSRLCEVFGHSSRLLDDVDQHKVAPTTLRLHEQRLRRLIKHYPQGAVFHYEVDGTLQGSSGDEGSSGSGEPPGKRPRRPLKDVEALSKTFKKVRSAAFYPIFDDSTGRWRSCAFVWTNSVTRLLDGEEDLGFLRTFGHCILAEVSRLESLAAHQAKTKFISTVSHELRSPLHAVLAGVEFLQETELDTFQQEMTNTINLAGKTLLDTVDHILDYSKISSSTRARRIDNDAAKDSRVSSLTSTEDGKESSIDLARLTEQVVETCVSAYRAQMHAEHSPSAHLDAGTSRLRQSLSGPSTSPNISSNVSVTLDITYRQNWLVKMHAGAWTRIVTNLVGNALKYTHKGHIAVRLETTSSDSSSREKSHTDTILFSVEDTGVGMSESFLSHGVFIPFKQENPHSTGTGLGLSIVKEITKSMGAELKVMTKRDQGTTFTIRLPLALTPVEQDTKATQPQQDPGRMTVDRFHLLSHPSLADGTTPSDPVGSSVSSTAREWLSAEICQQLDHEEAAKTAVCATSEQTMRAWQHERPEEMKDSLTALSKLHSHILVLAESIRSIGLPLDFPDLPLRPVFIHQPIGPRKLLQAIATDRDSTVAGKPTHAESLASPATPGEKISISRSNTDRTGSSDEDVVRSWKAKLTRQTTTTTTTTQTSTMGDTASKRSASSATSQRLTASTTPDTSFSSKDLQRNQSSESSITPRDTVLLVEDNHINMKLLIALVRKLKVSYKCAVNGREAVDLYRQDHSAISLVLMDMSMPIMDGFTATRTIREIESKHALSRTYIAALTGVTDAESKARAFDCGVDDFYSKPVGMSELKVILSRVKQDVPDVSTDDPQSAG